MRQHRLKQQLWTLPVQIGVGIALLVLGLAVMWAAVERGDESSAGQPITAAAGERFADEGATRGAARTPEQTIVSTAPSTTTSSAPPTTAPKTTTTTQAKKTPTTVAKRTPTTVAKKTPTTAKPAPAKAAAKGNYRELIAKYPWNQDKAYRIMMCESGGNPNAVNKSSGATGLFQIHPGGSKYKDPATNVAAAYSKYQKSGWKPWVCTG